MDKQRKITDDEVNQLFAFTKKHFVAYYDLQAELVDHLANAIEEKWQENPELNFESILQTEFKKFGVFGFMDVVERRQLALSKKYNKLLWDYFKEFFKLPRIILTIGTISVLVKSYSYFHPIVYAVIFASAVIFSFFRIIHMTVKYNKKVKKTGKRWMFEEIIYKGGSFGAVVFIPFHLTRYFFEGGNHIVEQWLLSTLLVCFLLYEYIMLFVIPAKAEKHLEETYPEYAFKI